MKTISISIVALAAIFAFKFADTGSISGKVTPADAASQVWAIQGSDTLKTPIADGTFTIKGVKAGTYTVIIGAKHPFKDVTVSNVRVLDDQTTDLGEIKISQE